MFDSLTQLTALVLSSNQLTALPDGVFDRLVNMQWLAVQQSAGGGAVATRCSCQGTDVHCHERRLASVPAGIPTTTQILRLYINQITKLEPGGNQLQALPEGVFDRLVNLQRLWLNNNQLTSLPTGVFDKLTQLTHIVLSTNQLRNVPQQRSAKQSRFNADQLKSIPRGAFDNLKSLTHIWLFDNPWDSRVFDSLVHLQELPLYSNKLSAIRTAVFDKLNQLTELSLGNNQLTSIPAGAFDQLMKLQKLWLYNNILTALPAGVFVCLSESRSHVTRTLQGKRVFVCSKL
ncbi:uncharacterized protein LOC144727929 [Lampetra planeri]